MPQDPMTSGESSPGPGGPQTMTGDRPSPRDDPAKSRQALQVARFLARPRARGPHVAVSLPVPEQRRREPRYLAIENALWMQWWQGGEHLGRAARLVNLSRHGAMIISWVLLEVDQVLRIYLEEADAPVGVQGRVLGVVEGTKAMHQFRVEFTSPCPDLFLEAAGYGTDALAPGSLDG